MKQYDPSVPEQQRRAIATPVEIGIVGAGRTRNGLGPFLATFFERAGCRVVAVAGRSVAGGQQNAAALGERLGHDVRPCRDVDELCASGITALVIASPPEHHLTALRAALAARLAALCEKPLVHEREGGDAAAVVSHFVDTNLLLAENCHWPYVLPSLWGLLGRSPSQPARHVALGLAAVAPGRVIVQNTLSHLLSVAQTVACVDGAASVEEVSLDRPSLHLLPNVLRCRVRGPAIDLGLALHLDLCPAPPRPAWLAIDDVRVDRRIGPGHTFSFVRNGVEIAVPDPMEQRVLAFSRQLRRADRPSTTAEGEAVRQRLRLYRDILSRLP